MKNFLILLIIPFLSFGQVFTVDDNYIQMYTSSLEGEFSENTFLNTLEETTITYEIILDSLPLGWDFQNCFPTCNPINTYNIDPLSFPSDSSIYLNAHFYPNSISGEGLLLMELSANHGTYLDTVSWRAIAMPEFTLNEYLNKSTKIKYITNISGQRISNLKSEQIVIVTYQNNQSKLVYILK